MSDWFFALSAVVLLFFSALFSGAETGVYSVSRVRLEAEAGQGRRAARILSGLLRDDAGLLITLLVGANLVQDLAALAFQAEIESWRMSSLYGACRGSTSDRNTSSPM